MEPDRRLALTENQVKVIRDKYLKDAPTPEAWLRGVARNIALAELLFDARSASWSLWEGIAHQSVAVDAGPGERTPLTLLHEGLFEASQRHENFSRWIRRLYQAAEQVPEAGALVSHWEAVFYDLMAGFDFLPNSPTLMNAGRELQQLSACYVLPVDDSLEGIMKALTAQALIHQGGGGTGFSFGRLRMKGDLVKSSKGVASGAVSFMQIFDKLTEVIKQGGVRRGANMAILPYWHPEIRDFITMKTAAGVMENFNVSVAVDASFMQAVRRGDPVELRNPRTREVVGREDARQLFERIVECAWRTGDPGLIFIDRINASGSNPTPALGPIESTNPCGEQPLLPYEPCTLGSLNLSRFVGGPLTHGEMEWDRLGQAVAHCVRFLDNTIEVNNYPLPEIERMAKGNRRIGLGVMGWAEALVKMGIPYDSEAALEKGRSLMKFINEKALEASEALAEERGVFPQWRGSIYDPGSPFYRGRTSRTRNCARTTIAPTGTIGIAAGLQGGGIEPFFALTYVRYNARALDAVRRGEAPDPKDTFLEVNPLFREVAQAQGFFGLSEEDLWAQIEANRRSVRGVAAVPPEVQRLFAVAHDVSVDFHVKVQAAFQEHTDNGVSKTINLPHTASVADVRQAYVLAYELGCKGITIYRDGSKRDQVLNLSPLPSAPAAAPALRPQPASREPKQRRAAYGLSAQYYEIQTGYGPLHVHINYDESGPFQVFTNLPPIGTEISGLAALVGVLLSKFLGMGGNVFRILKHLRSIKGDRPIGLGENQIYSIPHAIAVAMKRHLEATGQLKATDASELKPDPEQSAKPNYCPSCFSFNVVYESGCSGPTCKDCGYSECS